MADSNTSKAPRERKVNFTFAESNLISELVTEQLDLVKGKHSLEVTNIKKQEMWADITRRINALGVCLRTEAEVKNKWRNMTRGAKEKFTEERKERSKTGGGPAPQRPTQAEENIINALKDTASFKGIDGGLESSIIEIQESPCLEESGSADHAVLDLALSADERAFQKALDRHLETTGMPTTDSIQIASYANVGTDPVYPGSSRVSSKPPAKRRKTAEDVYTLQCAVLEKELVKHDLQIKLVQKILDNIDSIECTSHALSVLTALK